MKRLLILMLVLVAGTDAFATNGTRMIGFNAQTVGRGGTAIGLFDTPSLMMTNPAGIASLEGSSLDLQVSLLVPRVAFTNSVNNAVRRYS